MLNVGVLGASGMIGMQLTRLLSHHPKVAKVRPYSDRLAGTPFSALHPAFRDLREMNFEKPDHESLKRCDVLFLSVSDYGPYLDYLSTHHDTQVIDAGSGFRIDSAEDFRKIFGREHHAPALAKQFVSVVPEINPQAISGNSRITTQGCVSTAVALGLYPLLKQCMLVDRNVIVDAKVASSGSGSSSNGYSSKHFNRTNGVKAYRLLDEHRHVSELRVFFKNTLDIDLSLDINVFSIDLVRGISAAIYVQLKEGITERQVRKAFADAYAEHPLVRILKLNSGDEKYPNPKWLYGTGLCEIGFKVDEVRGRAVIIVALDNLMKGGASQAVQIFNMLNGFGTTEGIPVTPIYP